MFDTCLQAGDQWRPSDKCRPGPTGHHVGRGVAGASWPRWADGRVQKDGKGGGCHPSHMWHTSGPHPPPSRDLVAVDGEKTTRHDVMCCVSAADVVAGFTPSELHCDCTLRLRDKHVTLWARNGWLQRPSCGARMMIMMMMCVVWFAMTWNWDAV